MSIEAITLIHSSLRREASRSQALAMSARAFLNIALFKNSASVGGMAATGRPERGILKNPSLSTLSKIAQALGVSVDYLLGAPQEEPGLRLSLAPSSGGSSAGRPG